MRPRERHDRILGLLADEEDGRVDVNDLAHQLGVSQETVRRDLNKLAEDGLLKKVHGGATRFQRAREDTFGQRLYTQRAAKVAIGRYAATLLERGDSLFIDAGSTTILFSKQLESISPLTVITNSVAVAVELDGSHGNNVLLLGGAYSSEVGETLGPMVLEQIGQFHVDHAFLGAGGLNDEGVFTDFNLEEAHVARAMQAQASYVTMLIDSTKIGRTSLVRTCTANDINRVITDEPLPPALAELLDRTGVEVYVALSGDGQRSPARFDG